MKKIAPQTYFVFLLTSAFLIAPLSWSSAADDPATEELGAEAPPAADVPATAETTSTEEVVADQAAPAEDQIVIEYIEADLQSVLRSLASRAGINLIMGDEVIGKVTVHLENVTYEEAMKLIVESKGYAFVKEKTIVKVKSKESLEAEPVELRVFVLNYAKAEQVKATIQPVLTGRGTVQIDARSNTLIVSDTPSNLAKIEPLITTLDAQTPQVLIEAKFVETTKNPKKDLGINWSGTLLNHEVKTRRPVPGDDVETPGNQNSFTFIKDLSGGSWNPSTVILDAGDASIVFSYLNQDSDSELLASPRVVTTDNGRARISIATQFPIPNFTFSEQTASLQISGFEYKDIGIILDVLPRINKNDFVTLEVTPEASSSTENTTLQSGGGSAVFIPVINTRTASTTVLIKSGNTLAIGGLMRTDTSDNYTKVPILGDIPMLGALFRSKSLSKSKRDLLIFLTPTIIDPESQTGFEKYYDGLPDEEVFTNDKWMPRDNAKPRMRTPEKYFNFVSKKPATPNAEEPAPTLEEAPVIEFAPAEPVAEPAPVEELSPAPQN